MNGHHDDSYSNSEDETEIDPREVTIGPGNGDKTQRQLFMNLQNGSTQVESENERRRIGK